MALFKFIDDVGGLVVADAESALEERGADLLLVDDDLERADHDRGIGGLEILVRGGPDDVGVRHAVHLVVIVHLVVVGVPAGDPARLDLSSAARALRVFLLVLLVAARENAVVECLRTLGSHLVDDLGDFRIGDVGALNSFQVCAAGRIEEHVAVAEQFFRADDYDDEMDEYDVDGMANADIVKAAADKYLEPTDPPIMVRALEIIINEQQVSTSYLQRRLGIGYNKAADIIDKLEQRHVISAPLPGGQKRSILITDGLETSND